MALQQFRSNHLNVPFIVLTDDNGNKKFLCENGVLFTKEEYTQGIDLKAEYERREREHILYDYEYARKTGKLRIKETPSAEVYTEMPEPVSDSGASQSGLQKGILILAVLLGFTSLVSMYMSTLHTATYLKDYSDVISAWFMALSITAYNSTAFEVSIIFRSSKRNFMAFLFLFLWCAVTLFSMTTTVSVFYSRFSFDKASEEIAVSAEKTVEEELMLLKGKESALREAIEFKKKDIEYRQQKEYATAKVREELVALENDLQKNLEEQQAFIRSAQETREASGVRHKESLFAFLSRIFGINEGLLEFVMSTLSAVFINLIAPLSLSAGIELRRKAVDNLI